MNRLAFIFILAVGFCSMSKADYWSVKLTHEATPASSDMSGITGNEVWTLTAPAGNAVTNLTFYGAKPVTSSTLHNSQTTTNFKFTCAPTVTQTTTTDPRGNTITSGTLATLAKGASFKITGTYTATTKVVLKAFEPNDGLPLSGTLPADVAPFLNATALIQSGDAAIVAKANYITNGNTRIYDAVAAIGKWVYENTVWTDQVPNDAKSVLASNKGNCVGFSQLAVALLRAKGIPARVSAGLTLNKSQVIKDNEIELTIGNSGPGWHEIYEVYYPSLSKWVAADPQNSVHFNTNHFLKYSVGIDDDEAITFSVSYLTTGTAPAFASEIKTTVSTISGGYKIDGKSLITLANKAKTVFLGVEQLTSGGGMNDVISITSGPLSMGPYDQLSYYATFTDADYTGSYTEYWDWSINLDHTQGSYTIASDANVYGRNQVLWYKKLTGIPAGYKWKRNAKGNITGFVSLQTIDSDKWPHSVRIPIELVSYTGAFTVTGSTYNRPNSFEVQGTNGSPDMVYHLQLAKATVFNVSLCNAITAFDAKVEIFNSDGTTTNYYNDDDPSCSYSGIYPSLYGVALPAGDFYVVVDGFDWEAGAFQMAVTPAPAGQQTIAGFPFSHKASTVSRPNEWDVQNADGPDATYMLNLNKVAAIKMTTCDAYTNFNTMLEVFKGDRSRAGIYNNDATCTSGSNKSTISKASLAPGNYFVVVDGSSAAKGNYNLLLDLAYDNTITTIPYTNSNTTVGKKLDWQMLYPGAEDLAYMINLTYTTRLDISLVGTGTKFDTQLEIFNENGTTTGYYNDDASVSTLASELKGVVLNPGRYFIVVSGWSGATGAFVLSVKPNSMSKQAVLSKSAVISSLFAEFKKGLAKRGDSYAGDIPANMEPDNLKYELQKRANGGNPASEKDVKSAAAIQPSNLRFASMQNRISYVLPTESNVVISLFKLDGSKVASYKLGKQQAGAHSINLDRKMGLGSYICRINAGSKTITGKILLAR